MKLLFKAILAYSIVFIFAVFILAIDAFVNKFGVFILVLFVPCVAVVTYFLLNFIKQDEWYKIADPFGILHLEETKDEE